MALELIPSTRGTKVLLDAKHIKTIPKKYALVYTKVNPKMTFNKKRLNPDERTVMEIALQWQKYLEKCAVSDRKLHRFIKDTTPIDARLVTTPTKDRIELILDNNMKIVAPNEKIFKLFPLPKLVFQNF